ncbi:MAG TPA: NTP transferase domain-containing protein [Sphingomonas sp.]|nr:NTP transferase domain-containing protein [Sphingomonas sp.]
MTAPRWTALLLAGQRPGMDPLAEAFGQQHKALIPIAGEAMLSRVARTLLASPSIGNVLIIAQAPDILLVGDCAWLASEARVSTAASVDGIAVSVGTFAGSAAAKWPVLVTTADHPLLTTAMIEVMIAGVKGADVAVGVVSARTLLAAYPHNRRTWLKFGGGRWTGANLFALTSDRARPAVAAWSEVERDRKKAVKLLWHFGPVLALRAITGTITLDRALAVAGRRLGLVARSVPLAFAEAGIDVDKPGDHALAERILEARGDRDRPG